mmetsp:Transcript_8446/g.18133  ORF Transcript_8446/g.18133 Transcript_8446/m.18133 type:complete len:168 (+) Transcript_8446:68-571(+)|eukprot:CAMPEP_0185848666 /NCGR_PEP_ID=MMETSP1354-20130828/3457_1 /TAXON_ID=708628 /ORGANISM="Erythrolobus madagascarensis, Strain CCMP3276" /LENGTH=167 /DNA_ID=CAMNT_0028549083 /DNA_START=30 /DNA_END=533 /DNA_ORIENTATION=-
MGMTTSEMCFITGMLHALFGGLSFGEKLYGEKLPMRRAWNLYPAQGFTFVLVCLATATRHYELRPTDPGYMTFVVAEYAAMVVVQLSTIFYALRSYMVAIDPEEIFQLKYYLIMIVVDQIAFVTYLYMRKLRVKRVARYTQTPPSKQSKKQAKSAKPAEASEPKKTK